ncbi:hypothetical protein BKA66DRAFT_407290 [Pyrenochaeta sp. MPI-SDFR-AT-0127]|nr:hypothetical protein BKA66DRAFT_407290 [Pyrenochaeta sp. MPI-SDFR-AT-0127]
MSDQFAPIIFDMVNNPPDPNEPLPLANHKATMFGVTIPFHILSWIVVGFRLHTRLRVVREPGWDDFFVVLAALLNLVSVIAFLGGTRDGFGHHLIYVLPTLPQTMLWLYITSAAYHTTTALIKVSLLCQYLRIFREGLRRKVCFILLASIVLWGLAFSFMAWVPCFPVSGYWNRMQVPPPKCYGFGYRTIHEAKTIILAFAGTNMFFDIAVFAVPLTEYFRPGLMRKQILAMTGLFSLGSMQVMNANLRGFMSNESYSVVLMAVLRLWATWKNSKTARQSFDFTWWYPEVLIISCLEVDFAIMCASMPIFWPAVVASWSQIFVTKEVHVTHHQRLDNNSADYFEMNRQNSLRSTASTEGLTKVRSQEQESFYNIFNSDSGKGTSAGITQVEVQSYAKKPRML